MKKILLSLLLLLVAAPAVAQVTYIKTKTHTDAMEVMGQSTPAKDSIGESWFDGDRFASGSDDTWITLDASKNVVYFINKSDKSYVETTLPLDLAKVLPPEMAGMLDMVQMTAKVTPSPETKKIGSWTCTAWDATLTVMGMEMKMRIWAATDVPFDYAAFMAKMMPTMLQGQMRMAKSSIEEFAKIKGFQIATEMTGDIMGAKMRSVSEVVEITQKPAPEGVFAPPAGYTKKTTLNPADLIKK